MEGLNTRDGTKPEKWFNLKLLAEPVRLRQGKKRVGGVRPFTCVIVSRWAGQRRGHNLQLVRQLWFQSPSERSIMEPYSSLFLSDRVNRHDLKLALGTVHRAPLLLHDALDPD